MQPNPRPTPPRGPKYLDAKIMIAALSAAVTVGFWNLFAGQALGPQEGGAGQPVQDRASSLPPIPTLAPVVDFSGPAPVAGDPVDGGAAAPLRQVGAPTVVVIQKNRPQIDSAAVNVGGGGPGTQPVVTTRSSR